MIENILISLLARQDAVFAAIHDPDGNRNAVTTCLRCDYHRRGLPYIGETDQADRKRAERALAGIAANGLVEVFRSSGGARAVAIRLTEAGDWRARKLAGLPGERSMRAFLGHLSECSATDDAYCWAGRELVSLDTLAGCDPSAPKARDERSKLRDFIAPAVVRGLCETEIGTTGRVFAWLTVAGREYLGSHPDDGKRESFRPQRGMAGLYDAEYCRAVEWVRGLKPSDPAEIGRLLIPHGLMPRGIARERRLDPTVVNSGSRPADEPTPAKPTRRRKPRASAKAR